MIDLEKLRLVMDEVAEEKGPFTLFGLFLREDAPNRWDLVVSAPWLEDGKLKALEELTKKLTAVIGEGGVMELSRIVTVKEGDPALESVLRAVSVETPSGTTRFINCNFFGLEIKEAHIFRAVRPSQKKK